MSNCLDELVDSFIKVVFIVEVVSVFFVDLRNDFLGEVCSEGDLLGFNMKVLLHQRVDFDIVFHFIELAKNFLCSLSTDILSQIVNRIIFNLNFKNLAVRGGPVDGNSVGEVVNDELGACRVAFDDGFNFNHVVVEKLHDLLFALQRLLA